MEAILDSSARVIAVSTATSKGQITIPKPIRDALGIEDGTPVEWELQNGDLRVRARSRRLVDLAGVAGNPLGAPVSIEEMNETVRDAASDLDKRSA